MKTFLEIIGVLLLVFGAWWIVSRFFYYAQKATGVRLVQNRSQAREIRSLEEHARHSLVKEDPLLVELAKKQCREKGFSLTISNISEELEILKTKLNR
ncbi:hypothetical protein [Algoriphagus algorifonticola]|uniref:hypothetical protein n=1 Tax=Algoriphagus algorifonticola TaxID=2593007 RepID=UPI0011A2B1BA|nr:hypothetical protein [Algoriphagus algorifonticola]